MLSWSCQNHAKANAVIELLEGRLIAVRINSVRIDNESHQPRMHVLFGGWCTTVYLAVAPPFLARSPLFASRWLCTSWIPATSKRRFVKRPNGRPECWCTLHVILLPAHAGIYVWNSTRTSTQAHCSYHSTNQPSSQQTNQQLTIPCPFRFVEGVREKHLSPGDTDTPAPAVVCALDGAGRTGVLSVAGNVKWRMCPCRCCSLTSRFGAQTTPTVALVRAPHPVCGWSCLSCQTFCIAFTHALPWVLATEFDLPPPAVRAKEGGHITYTAPETPYVVGDHVRTVIRDFAAWLWAQWWRSLRLNLRTVHTPTDPTVAMMQVLSQNISAWSACLIVHVQMNCSDTRYCMHM